MKNIVTNKDYNYIEDIDILEEGIYLVDKPIDWTSYDVINYIKARFGKIKIGHFGTLDPFASGLLLVAIGKQYTRQNKEFSVFAKKYTAKAILGSKSTTDDKEGELEIAKCIEFSEETLRHILLTLSGTYNQLPPDFSAKKVDGQRAYKLARENKEFKLAKVLKTINEIELLQSTKETIDFKVTSSTGTYIRAIARDIGVLLGGGAYLAGLRRTAIGDYRVEDALKVHKTE